MMKTMPLPMKCKFFNSEHIFGKYESNHSTAPIMKNPILLLLTLHCEFIPNTYSENTNLTILQDSMGRTLDCQACSALKFVHSESPFIYSEG